LQVAAAGLLYVFGYLRRFGRVSEPLLPGRSSPLELVEARAGVFQTAGARGLAAELIVQNVSQDLAKAHGKPVDVSELSHELDVMDKSNSSAKRLASLRALSGKAARGEKLTDQEFVDLGRVAGQIVQGRMP
jgi:hypothetical protein